MGSAGGVLYPGAATGLTPMDERQRRRRALLRLLEENEFSSQEEIVAAMREKGFDVTQPSISRDFRELNVIKISGRYKPGPTDNGSGIENGEPWGLVRKVERVGANLVVVKTGPGAAGVVADAVDKLSISGVAGTVAGDDTLFVATKNRAAQDRLLGTIVSD